MSRGDEYPPSQVSNPAGETPWSPQVRGRGGLNAVQSTASLSCLSIPDLLRGPAPVQPACELPAKMSVISFFPFPSPQHEALFSDLKPRLDFPTAPLAVLPSFHFLLSMISMSLLFSFYQHTFHSHDSGFDGGIFVHT